MKDGVSLTKKPAISAATGLSYGQPDGLKHAETAVRRAMKKLGSDRASAILLLLTPDHAQNPKPAIRAAARIANCTQIFGCTGPGLITEEDWVLDASGAAAMAFKAPIQCLPAADSDNTSIKLCFCEAENVSVDWLQQSPNRYGAVAADSVGNDPYRIWQGAAVQQHKPVQIRFSGVQQVILSSRGIRILSQPRRIADSRGYELLRLGDQPALDVLMRALPEQANDKLATHMLMCAVTYGNPQTAIEDGRYHLNHILSCDAGKHSITLSDQLQPGDHVFWVIRDQLAAEFDFQFEVSQAAEQLKLAPDFAILLPCISRGPTFYTGDDRDLEVLKKRYPAMPIIGFYNNGQLSPGENSTRLHRYSAVASLFVVNS